MASEIKRILFASDLSEGAKLAFDRAVNVAVRHGAVILIAHVMEKLAPGTEERVATVFGDELYEELKHRKARSARDILINKKVHALRARNEMERIYCESMDGNAERSSIVEDICVVEGDVATELLALARQESCDLIVMGKRSRVGIARTFSRGRVEKVIRRSDKPVLVVPYKDSPGPS